MPSIEICRPAEIIGEVRRRYTLQTLVSEEGELIFTPLRCFEPMQLAKERSNVVAPRRGKYQPSWSCQTSRRTHLPSAFRNYPQGKLYFSVGCTHSSPEWFISHKDICPDGISSPRILFRGILYFAVPALFELHWLPVHMNCIQTLSTYSAAK